jgi:hypothetical protein
MKKLLFLALLFCSAIAASADLFTETVSFSLGIVGASSSATMKIVDENTTAPYVAISGVATTLTESTIAYATVKPGKSYAITVWGPSAVSYKMSFTAPLGYTVVLDGKMTDMLGNTGMPANFSDPHTFELRPAVNFNAGILGHFAGVKVGGAISWEVDLGRMQNGRSAGQLCFREKDLSSGVATRAKLFYGSLGDSGQVVVLRDANQAIRQLSVPQGFLDLEDDTTGPGGYTINFYNMATDIQTAPYPQLWVIIPGHNPWKTIHVQTTTAGNQLQVTEKEN